jgi:hypothetical protein
MIDIEAQKTCIQTKYQRNSSKLVFQIQIDIFLSQKKSLNPLKKVFLSFPSSNEKQIS